MSSTSTTTTLSLFLFLFLITATLFLSSSDAKHHHNKHKQPYSLSFPLSTVRVSPNSAPQKKTKTFGQSLVSSSTSRQQQQPQPAYNYKLGFKYSMALVVPLPVGTPPQIQQMVLDTGSQLSWIQCHKKIAKVAPPPPASFDPSLSSTFSTLPCSHPLCKPRIPDFTLPTSCDQNRLCHYSYFYADGTFAEGNLVRERFTFSRSVTTPPFILGCAQDDPSDTKGILGMNLGRLSFASQAGVKKFSYCVPARNATSGSGSGSFYLGNNPNSRRFRYVPLLTFPESQRMPNFDPLAFTVPMQGIRVGGKRLDIPAAAFRPDAGGSGQTMVDSGSEFSYLVDAAYDKVRAEVVSRVGPRMKAGYVYGDVADMCFESRDAAEVGRLVGEVAFLFDRGVEIVAPRERVLADVGGGVHCLAIGRSNMLGAASNIIGNFHQQNLWVEFDLVGRRIGFGKAECSRS